MGSGRQPVHGLCVAADVHYRNLGGVQDHHQLGNGDHDQVS
jgi:hypothetical protein